MKFTEEKLEKAFIESNVNTKKRIYHKIIVNNEKTNVSKDIEADAN